MFNILTDTFPAWDSRHVLTKLFGRITPELIQINLKKYVQEQRKYFSIDQFSRTLNYLIKIHFFIYKRHHFFYFLKASLTLIYHVYHMERALLL